MTENAAKQDDLNISHYFLFILIASALFLCYRMMSAYLDSIIAAVLLSALTNPVYQRICSRYGNSTVAAGISCLLLTLIILIPLALMSIAIIQQGIRSFTAINQWIRQGNLEALAHLPVIADSINLVKGYLAGTSIDLSQFDFQAMVLKISSLSGEFLVNQGGNLFGNLSSMAGKFCLTIFVYFFVVQEQRKLARYVLHLMPLSTAHETFLTSRIKSVAKSALLGTLATSIAQGVAGGIAFAICGIPGFFWGTVMGFASLIPMVGTAIVWVPAAGYLFISGSIGSGIFLIIWSVLVVGMLDNLVRPLFMKGSAEMGTLLIFFSILGGINIFGLIGLLYGPLIFGVTLVLLTIYDLEFRRFLDSQDNA